MIIKILVFIGITLYLSFLDKKFKVNFTFFQNVIYGVSHMVAGIIYWNYLIK